METAIYARVSTEEQAQEGYSIRAQEQKLKEFAKIKEWSVYGLYVDEAISGKNITARPAINRMIEDIKAGHIKNVLVFKLDRLTRSVADLVYLIDLFKQNDCDFNSLMESLDTSTASGRMFIKIIGIFAEFERENIAERVRVGKERKAREGFSNSTKHPSYGYEREKGQKVQTVNEAEAKNVKMIFDMYVNRGLSLSAIAANLNLQKIPTKHNNFWNAAAVRATLLNCSYIGNVRYCMDDPTRYFEAEGRHEAIISEDLFYAAKMLIEKNRRTTPTKKPNESNFFVNFLYCAECGEKMAPHNTVVTHKDGQKSTVVSFQCRKRMAKACDSMSVSAGKVERALVEYFLRIKDTFVQEGVEAERQEQERRDNEARIKALRDKLRRLDSKGKDIMSYFIHDNIDFDSYRSMIKQLDSDRDVIRAELKKLAVGVDVHPTAIRREDIIADFRRNWQNLTNTEKRLFLTNFIKKIVVRNEPIVNLRFGNTSVTDIEFNAI